MTDREKIVSTMSQWVGYSTSNGGRNKIIDIYNSYTPLPRGYKVKYDDNWCAVTVSAAAIQAGLSDKVPIECSCGQMINIAIKNGIWVDDDAYIPQPGDILLFDWQDSGAGNNTGWPDHVGLVESVTAGYIITIEGNTLVNGERAVGRRKTALNGKFIRGFITPKYNEVEKVKIMGTLDGANDTMCGGWVYDGTNKRYEVHVYLYNSTGNVVTAYNGIIADEERADLKPAGIGDGKHAYTFVHNFIDDVPAGKYIVRAYAIAADNSNPCLGEKQIEVRARSQHQDYNPIKESRERLRKALETTEETKGILENLIKYWDENPI